jgi:voltage-gated potassium channel
MVQVISKLAGHTIVCGSNQMAEVVIERLTRKRKKVVVVDEDKDRLAELQKRYRRIMTIEGAATNELNLADANVLSAANVVAALPSDLDNLLIAITCRDLNEEIAVYAESNDLTVANRMRKAGVDRVVNPSQLCGMHVSDQILSP